tara:strand:+ start:466 stop:1188 length:723 start_codon:yes stop_codon:yes gene_type:complete
MDYDPDLVIFFDGYNDHFINNVGYDSYADNIYQFWKEKHQRPSVDGIVSYILLYLSEFSGLARGLYSRKLINYSTEKAAANPAILFQTGGNYNRIRNHKRAAKKEYLRSMEVNLVLLRNFGIKTIVCFQPELALRDVPLLTKIEKSFLPYQGQRKLKYRKMIYPLIHPEVRNLTNKFEVLFIDMVPLFNSKKLKNKQLFIDYTHLAPLGGQVVAEALFLLVEVAMLAKSEKVLGSQIQHD